MLDLDKLAGHTNFSGKSNYDESLVNFEKLISNDEKINFKIVDVYDSTSNRDELSARKLHNELSAKKLHKMAATWVSRNEE